jgi:hypothetical protein
MCFELCGPESSDPEVSSESDEMEDMEEDFIEVLTDSESYARYDDTLNECYPTVNICGYDYAAARAFKEVDPIAYQTEYNNWLDSELREGSFTLAE